jgi:hypothetical protein
VADLCRLTRPRSNTQGQPEAVRAAREEHSPAASAKFASFPAEERAHRFRVQTECGHPESSTTSGLVAYVDGNPVGWCAVEPRRHYSGLVRNKRVPG